MKSIHDAITLVTNGVENSMSYLRGNLNGKNIQKNWNSMLITLKLFEYERIKTLRVLLRQAFESFEVLHQGTWL